MHADGREVHREQSGQASKPAIKQANNQANKQASKESAVSQALQANHSKYSTNLQHTFQIQQSRTQYRIVGMYAVPDMPNIHNILTTVDYTSTNIHKYLTKRSYLFKRHVTKTESSPIVRKCGLELPQYFSI